MSSGRKKLLVILTVVLVAGGGYYYYQMQSEPPSAPIIGMVRQTEIRLAPEVNGRLQNVAVSPGQHVAKGDLLALIDNPDLVAAVGEGEAALVNARADRANVDAGVRKEEVQIDAEAVHTAEANLTLAQQVNTRTTSLAQQNIDSRSQAELTQATLAKAAADLDQKKAIYAEALAGPISEERALAAAKVTQSSAAVTSSRAKLDKTRIIAPGNGTIGTTVSELGEVLTPGKPVLTFIPDGGTWFAFTVREDNLDGLAIGSKVTLDLDDGKQEQGTVTEFRPLGEFATWRAARAVGDHDLNSFFIRVDPTGDSGGLSPGMTVFLHK
ncbi:HlyD family secretion protein [Methylovirgula sp. 4M-Z18]|uniref:HlyD family secretion protein n=1 Tax=Methylovirgula sp. 4M-Z18 TaxID=2293567 RepID=UPI000E2F827C|nr:efflux RND transporter periplasmic adaptor subunit [Methylovirgula sp. 4M-Z18]RFB80930.1 HlyD family efflux transporter periplasmic adaptor subunit [Methylovirgula sp. 4M-Z18]